MKGLPASVVIAIMIVIVLVPANAAADPPVLNFIDPTEPNDSHVSRNWTESNITIDEPQLDTFRFNWNSTNYTFYDDSLVLAMNFNNNSAIGENSTHAVDISKYGNNGTIYGANQTTNGKFGSALEFDGTDDHVDCGNDTSLQFGTGNFSVELWVKYTTTYSRCFISTINVDWTKGWFIETASSGKIDFFTFEDPVEGIAQSGQLYNDNIWHHVTGVRKLNKVYLYVDGVQVANASESTPVNVSNAGNLSIAYTEGDGWYTNGTIDSVRIYNRSLSADEIYRHYQSELSKYNSTQWRFYTNTTGLTDGTYTYYGWANDTAGNEGQTETRTLTVDTTPPAVNTVTLNTTTPNTGDAILVTVNATDNVAVTNVTADGVELTHQSGNIWDGTIIAEVGTHSMNVSAVDAAGNTGWNNSTSYTATTPDTTPPASITGPDNTTYEQTYINWTWTDPLDADFSKVMVYLDGTFKENVTKGIRFYNATGLTADTEHEIATRTVDNAGNINDTWKNDTARTAIPPEPETLYLIYGWVFYKNGTACDNPVVNITNTNTSKQWQAETNVNHSYYQLILDTTNISAGNVLEFNASGCSQANTTEHTVTQDEINDSGMFNFNITLASPDLVIYTISNRTITPPQTTDIDVKFSEEVEWKIAIENGGVVYDWTGTSTNPNKRTWNGTYEGNDTIVPDGTYTVNITWTNTTTDLGGQNNTETITVSKPPASITDLANTTYQETYINWTWTDPEDADFSHVMVYIDGISQPNVTKGTQFYNATGLTHNTEYEISTHTVDDAGNTNATWVNDTARTKPTPDTTAPVVNTVTLDPTTPNTGDAILVTVDATDDVAVMNVTADGVELTSQGGNIWNGTITAVVGTHSVNVSAVDVAGNTGWNNLTSYTATTPDATAPVVNTVTLDPTTPNTGDAILVTVDATDNVAVTNVTADGVELTYQSGNIWDGTIIAIVGTHSVNVSAVDATGNTGWNNSTSYTATTPDTTPPASITDLQNTAYQETYINWTWTDPLDADFSKVMVYLDGTLKENVTKGIRFYNATGLTHNTEYEISTHTVDSAGNINDTWKNDTAKTAVSPEPETPYLTYGWVFYKNGTACDNPTVNITNSNTSKQWQAETNVDYSYYQLILDTTNISAGNVLEFNAASPNGNQTNITEHAVTQEEVNAGGFFDFNLTLESTGDLPPSLVTYTITNTTISPNGDGIMDDTEIDVEFSEYVSAAIKIENVSGVVQSLYTSNNVKDPNPKTWDGTDDGDNVVADGIYYVNITGTNTSTELSVINNTECIVVDTTPPVITDNSPTGAGAPVSTNITATFNEAMNPDTLNNETVTVEHNGTAVNGNVTYDAPLKTVTFDPAGDLNYSETYNVTIATDVQDIAGNNISSNVTWNFTTSSTDAIISIGNVSGNTTVPITIEGGANVGSVQINITYNTSVCIITEVANGTFDCTLANIDNETGWASIGAWQGNNSGLNGSIILANVTFRSNSTNGTSPLNLSVVTFTDATNSPMPLPYIVQNGTYTAVLNGDVNGDGVVNIADAMYLAKHVLWIAGWENINEDAADVDGNGRIDLADVMYLTKHVLEITGFEELR